MKPVTLCLVLAGWFHGCGSGGPSDVKVHAVGMIDGKPLHMYTAIYRADASRQTVLWWVEGGPDSPLALEKCKVRDGLNWRCERSDTPTAAGSVMVDGRYSPFGVDAQDWKFLTDAEWKDIQAQQK